MRHKLISSLALICLVFTVMGGGLSSAAFAAETTYTSVLEDLQTDEGFDVTLYPLEAEDLSLDVIQIAESSDQELFVYVYQPSGNTVTVSSINICQDSPDATDRHWYNYKLKLLSIEDALGKYKVEGIVLKNDLLRYYDITSIYRLPLDNEAIQGTVNHGTAVASATLPNGNITDEVAYPIEKLFRAATIDGAVTYSEEHSEAVELTDIYGGTLVYSSGIAYESFFQPFYDKGSLVSSHFVAFSVGNFDIDMLYEADVSFEATTWLIAYYGSDVTKIIEKVRNKEYNSSSTSSMTRTAQYKEIVPFPESKAFGYKFEWDRLRIQSASDFISSEELTSSARAAIAKQQWVVRFYETETTVKRVDTLVSQPFWSVSGVDVAKATVLRLKFMAQGVVYNLGVVSNKVTDTNGPDNTDGVPDPLAWWKEFVESWNTFWNKVGSFFQSVGSFFAKNWWILVVVGVLFLLGILSIFFPVLRVVFKVLWVGIKWILKIIWYIVSAPARLIVFIVNKVKERKIE